LSTLLRKYGLLFVLFALINITWFAIFSGLNRVYHDLSLWGAPVLSLFLLCSSLAALIIFYRGVRKNPKDQTFHTFISVSSKFLTELVITLIWFAVMKKTGFADILLFFLLYLAFSIVVIVTILKTLRINKL